MRPLRSLLALVAGPLLALALVQPAGAAAYRHQYRADDLGVLPGGTFAAAMAVNNRGVAVGYSNSPTGTYAVMWQHGKMTILAQGTAGHAVALDVNDAGQVALYLDGMGAIWDHGTVTRIGVSSPFKINEHGDVVGIGGQGAAVWRHGATVDLGPGAAYGLNGRDQVAGWSLTDDGQQRATLWDHGRKVYLAPEPSVATDVNQRGQVSGRAVRDGVWQAFRWQDGRLTWLGETGPVWPIPQRINNRGDVLGLSTSGEYLSRRGVMYDLGDLIGPYGSVFDLNDRDQLAGWYTVGEVNHAVVWR